jgi:hypothetical protein
MCAMNNTVRQKKTSHQIERAYSITILLPTLGPHGYVNGQFSLLSAIFYKNPEPCFSNQRRLALLWVEMKACKWMRCSSINTAKSSVAFDSWNYHMGKFKVHQRWSSKLSQELLQLRIYIYSSTGNAECGSAVNFSAVNAGTGLRKRKHWHYN